MVPKHDIGWEHAKLVGGIIRLKQHIVHIFKQVEGCPCEIVKMSQSVRQHMFYTSKERAGLKK